MNPNYDGTFVFDNDFPALQPDAPNPGNLAVAAVGGGGGEGVGKGGRGEEAGPLRGLLLSDHNLLPQDPVIIPFSKQRLLEEFGNYRFPFFNPGLRLSARVGLCA